MDLVGFRNEAVSGRNCGSAISLHELFSISSVVGGWLGQIGKAGTGCPFWLLLPACCVADLILSSEMFRLWGFMGVNSLGSFCYTDLGFMT